MSMKKIFGFGAAIWVLVFVVICVLIPLRLDLENIWLKIGMALLAGAAAFVFAGYAKPGSFNKALIYGFSWAAIGLILDFFVSRYYAPDIFKSWSYWLGYVLLVIAPILRIKKEGSALNPKVTQA